MSLFTIQQTHQAKRLTQQMEDVIVLLSRLTSAIERLAGPPLPSQQSAPYRAGLGDLQYTDARSNAALEEELDQFARSEQTVPGSEAFLKQIRAYEKQVGEVYGDEAILELPWNKAAGVRLFEVRKRGTDPRAQNETHAGQKQKDREPASDPPSQAEPESSEPVR